ncbi:hypothetical protein RJ55_05624 [Drechmeria coniospora]|nr:hypothetical protein RJ55_05624 [Drechmeria coniospora]
MAPGTGNQAVMWRFLLILLAFAQLLSAGGNADNYLQMTQHTTPQGEDSMVYSTHIVFPKGVEISDRELQLMAYDARVAMTNHRADVIRDERERKGQPALKEKELDLEARNSIPGATIALKVRNVVVDAQGQTVCDESGKAVGEYEVFIATSRKGADDPLKGSPVMARLAAVEDEWRTTPLSKNILNNYDLGPDSEADIVKTRTYDGKVMEYMNALFVATNLDSGDEAAVNTIKKALMTAPTEEQTSVDDKTKEALKQLLPSRDYDGVVEDEEKLKTTVRRLSLDNDAKDALISIGKKLEDDSAKEALRQGFMHRIEQKVKHFLRDERDMVTRITDKDQQDKMVFLRSWTTVSVHRHRRGGLCGEFTVMEQYYRSKANRVQLQDTEHSMLAVNARDSKIMPPCGGKRDWGCNVGVAGLKALSDTSSFARPPPTNKGEKTQAVKAAIPEAEQKVLRETLLKHVKGAKINQIPLRGNSERTPMKPKPATWASSLKNTMRQAKMSLLETILNLHKAPKKVKAAEEEEEAVCRVMKAA